MSKRARMMDLAESLVAPDERSETARQPKPRAEKPKIRKLVFRKPGKPAVPHLADTVEVERPYGERGNRRGA